MTTPSEITGRIYSDNEITSQVVRVINEATEQLAIVSPYIDRVPHVEQAITRAKQNGARVIVFARKDGDQIGGRKDNAAVAWFKANDIEVEGVPHLHAKFYMNEREAVVTSMNLLKSSWSGSLELGFVVEGDAHQQLISYLRETLRVVTAAKETETKKKPKAKSTRKRPTTKPAKRPRAPKPKEPEPKKGFFGTVFDVVRDILVEDEGYCIRCGELLSDAEFNDGKTMCRKDYLSWAKFRRPNFPEKFCTTCGNPRETTFAKPQCRYCYADENGLS